MPAGGLGGGVRSPPGRHASRQAKILLSMLRAIPLASPPPPRSCCSCLVALAGAPASPQPGSEPLDFDRGATGLGLALRRVGTTGRVLYVTAHPDDEHNGILVRLVARARPAHGAPHRHARRGRAERDRAGAVRRARRAAHGRAAVAPPLRRGRAVLRPRLRVRLLVQRRGDLREVGPGGDARRRRARGARVPPGRDRHAAAPGHGRRPAPPRGRAARARGVPGRGRPRALPGAGASRAGRRASSTRAASAASAGSTATRRSACRRASTTRCSA